MKISRIILTALTALVVFVSCNKDNNDNNDKVGIEGRWIGTYINDASADTFYYSFNIKPGGVIEEVNSSGVAIGTGTWQLVNNTHVFTAQYTWVAGGSYSVIGVFDSQHAKMIGDWGYNNSNTDGGSWEMTKSN